MTSEYPYEDRELYLRHDALPRVRFLENRGIACVVDSAGLEQTIRRLEKKERPLSKEEAWTLLYSLPGDLWTFGRRKLGFLNRMAYDLFTAFCRQRYSIAYGRYVESLELSRT